MTHIAPYRRRGACLFLMLVMATSCADGASDQPAASSAEASDSVSPVSGETWLAALRVEANPNALDADTGALKDVLGGALVVSPASCFRGLPADVDASAYVLGVQASTQAGLHTLVDEADRDAVFEAQVEVMCTD